MGLLDSSEPRGWTWFFQRIWTAVARSHGRSQQSLPEGWRVPWTVVLQGGEPRLWVGWDALRGRLGIRSLLSPPVNEGRTVEGGTSSSPRMPLSLVVDTFLLQQKGADGECACVAYYNDGTLEGLSCSELSYLSKIHSWRASLWGLQEYIGQPVSVLVTRSGRTVSKDAFRCIYPGASQAEVHVSLSQSEQKPRMADEALMAIVRMLESDEPSEDEIEQLGPPLRATRITEVELEWVVDRSGIKWLTKPYRLRVSLEPLSRLELRAALQQEREQAAHLQARSVAGKLWGLLRLAQRRGLTSGEVFEHFDRPCDARSLSRGLKLLGIGADQQTCAYLMKLLAGENEPFITEEQLWAFGAGSAMCEQEGVDDDKGGGGGNDDEQDNGHDQVKEAQPPTPAAEAHGSAASLRGPSPPLPQPLPSSSPLTLLPDLSPLALNGFPTLSAGANATGIEVFSSPSLGAVLTYRLHQKTEGASKGIIIAVAGLLQPLGELETLLAPLIRANPYLQVLTVGLPGAPNTHWPVSQSLTPSFGGRALLELLSHLAASGQILRETETRVGSSPDPAVLVGCGPAAAALLWAAGRGGNKLGSILSSLNLRLKAVVAANAFVQGSLHQEPSINALSSALRATALGRSADGAVITLPDLERLLLSRDFCNEGHHHRSPLLANEGAEDLRLEDLGFRSNLPCSDHASAAWEAHVNVQALLAHAAVASGMAHKGSEGEEVHALMRGLSASGAPLLLLQSTADAVVSTPLPAVLQRHLPAKALRQAKVDTVAAAFDDETGGLRESSIASSSAATAEEGYPASLYDPSWRLHVSWLQAGHALFLERPGYVLSVLDAALHAHEDKGKPDNSDELDAANSPALESAGEEQEEEQGARHFNLELHGDEHAPSDSIAGDAPIEDTAEEGAEGDSSSCAPEQQGEEEGQEEEEQEQGDEEEKVWGSLHDFALQPYFDTTDPDDAATVARLMSEIEGSSSFDLAARVRASHVASLRSLEDLVAMVSPDVIHLSKIAFDSMRKTAIAKIHLAEATARDAGLTNSLAEVEGLEREARRTCRYLKLKGVSHGEEFDRAWAEVCQAELACNQLRREKAASQARLQRLETVTTTAMDEQGCIALGLRKMAVHAHQQFAILRIETGVLQKSKAIAEHEVCRLVSRIEELRREVDRVSAWELEWIDTDVWQPGQLQRIRKADLESHMQREHSALSEKLQHARSQLESATRAAQMCIAKQKSLLGSVEALGSMVFVLGRADAELKAVPVSSTCKVVDFTSKKDLPRGHRMSVAERVRHTPHYLRSGPEKLWVGLDMKINPHAYGHVGAVEAQEMVWDAAYRSPLEASDVQRLLALPAPVQLALPFLRTPLELQAHEVLCEYSRVQSDEHFRAVDAMEDQQIGSTAEEDEQKLRERAHKGLEATCTPLCQLTLLQSVWLALDEILRPELYDPSDYAAMSPCHNKSGDVDTLSDPHGPMRQSILTTYSRAQLVSLITEASPPRSGESGAVEALVRQAAWTFGFPVTEAAAAMATILSPVQDVISAMSHGAQAAARAAGHSSSSLDTGRQIPAPEVMGGDPLDVISASRKAPVGKEEGHMVCRTLAELKDLNPLDVRRRGVLVLKIAEGDYRRSLLDIAPSPMAPGESRRHVFSVPDSSPAVALSISIIFQGDFEHRGYRLGRLGAALFRMGESGVAPEAIGFAPHSLQSLNTHASMGRLVILHRPPPPLRPGQFCVVIGAAAACRYSLTVTVATATEAGKVAADSMVVAQRLQDVELPELGERITAGELVVELTRRKLAIVRDLVQEAQSELRDVDRHLHQVNCDLLEYEADDALSDQAGALLLDQAQALEVQREQLSGVLDSRLEERRDVAEGLREREENLAQLRCRREELVADLSILSKSIPSALLLLRGAEAASEAGLRLKVSVDAVTSDSAQWAAMSAVASQAETLLNAAQLVRWRLRESGNKSLEPEEREFVSLDRTLHPAEYDWMSPGDEPKASSESITELRRIMAAPFTSLSRREVLVWKLIKKFHGDSGSGYGGRQASHSSAAARAKPPSMRSSEERDWKAIEAILFPQFTSWLEHLGTGAKSRAPLRLLSAGSDMEPADDRLGPQQSDDSDTEGKSGRREAWSCPFSRERLLELWRGGENDRLQGDERKVVALMSKYAGTFDLSALGNGSGRPRGAPRRDELTTSGRIALTTALHAAQLYEWEGNSNLRLGPLLEELHRVDDMPPTTKYVDSHLLHAQPQRFYKDVYKSAIEAEIDRIVAEQIRERERALALAIGPYAFSDDKDGAVSESTEGEGEDWEAGVLQAGNDDVTVPSYGAIADGREDAEQGVLESWSAYVDEKQIDARLKQLHAEIRRLQAEAGSLGVATRRRSVTASAITESTVQTHVPLSAIRGGRPQMSLNDAVREMRWESNELSKHIQLADMDRELHNALLSDSASITVSALHKYPTLMRRSEAVEALSAAREQLIARVIAVEVVDDMLESMLEGWLFGERTSEYSAAGYVPSFKKSGPLRPGDQRRAASWLEQKVRERAEARSRGERIPHAESGTPFDKAAVEVEPVAQSRIRRALVVQGVQDQRHLLDTVDNTLQYGAVTLVLSFFHSMACVRREKHSWGGTYDAVGPGGARKIPLTLERRKLIAEEGARRERHAAKDLAEGKALRGANAREARRLKDLADKARRAAVALREAKHRERAARDLQRLVRGYFGRRVSRICARRKAEVDALKSVIHQAAIQIQRVYRGHLARRDAAEVRMELAEFMTAVRIQEAESDIADFWATNPTLARRKKLGAAAGNAAWQLRRWGSRATRRALRLGKHSDCS